MSTKRLRVGVDFHTWDGIFQGSRSHVLGLYRAAIRQAPDMDFVFFLEGIDSLKAAHPEFNAPNVQLISARHRSGLVRFGVQLAWLQWRHGIDILHTQYRIPLVPVGPTACTIHDLLFETHPQYFSRGFTVQSKITFRMAARWASVLFSVSEFSRGELARLYGVNPERVAVTYNGVDRRRFFPGAEGREDVVALGLTPGNYILTVGRLEPRKNQAALIRAWARLGEDAPPLVIVGQRDFSFAEVFEALKAVRDPSRVVFLDRVSDAALPAVMRHAKVFAYPAFAEGFGMPVAEAMASGVPVLTSNTTSLPEVAGEGAWLVDPASVESIHDGLVRLLSDEALTAQLVHRAEQRVHRFDWELSAQTFLSGLRAHFAERVAA
jgi:glycosyltransferase involved in cell wall biosynthesis